LPSCPICEQPIASSSEHCGVCGFPTGLAIEALRSLSAGETPEPAPVVVPPGARGEPTPPSAPPPEVELTATIGRSLIAGNERMRALGRDLPNITSDLCEAALSEAAGHVAQALEILRAAQARFEEQTEEALRRRARTIDDRRRALERTGLRIHLPVPLAPADGHGVGDPGAVLDELAGIDRRLTRIESDWKGIQGLLAQAELLRSDAAELGFPIGSVAEEIAALRDQLASPDLTPELLDGLAEGAAQTLLQLHELVPTSLESELAKASATLGAFPADHPASRPARKLHEEASAHLQKGRLNEAVQSVKDLRRAIRGLEAAPPAYRPAPVAPVSLPRTEAAPPPSAPSGPPPPPAASTLPEETVSLEVLLKKARSLAARVRTLPADSEAARGAAAKIREATELLRAQRLEEANRTLTDLMRSLAEQGSEV
jgi:hypothetical protein